MDPSFFKKSSFGLGLDLKKCQNDPKIRFLGFLQKSNPFRCGFVLRYENANCILTFCKNLLFGKNLVLELWSKNQNTEFFKLQYTYFFLEATNISPESCLYFQAFCGSKLLNGCLLV